MHGLRSVHTICYALPTCRHISQQGGTWFPFLHCIGSKVQVTLLIQYILSQLDEQGLRYNVHQPPFLSSRRADPSTIGFLKSDSCSAATQEPNWDRTISRALQSLSISSPFLTRDQTALFIISTLCRIEISRAKESEIFPYLRRPSAAHDGI